MRVSRRTFQNAISGASGKVFKNGQRAVMSEVTDELSPALKKYNPILEGT
jgi:hypothetical protein